MKKNKHLTLDERIDIQNDLNENPNPPAMLGRME